MSGALGIAACMGAAAVLVDIVDDTVTTGSPGGTSTSTYTLNSNGTRTNGTWLLIGANSDYECKAHLNSGSALSSGALDTWQALSTTRSWSLSSTNQDKQSVLDMQIRRASDGVVLDQCTITLNADNAP